MIIGGFLLTVLSRFENVLVLCGIHFSDFLDFLEFLKIYRVMWMLKKQKFSSYLAINEFSDCEHVKRSTSKMKH